MAEELQLALLGNPEIRLAGRPLMEFGTNKAQALLCYLVLTGRPHLRPALAGLLWGELPEVNAHNNLRKALSNLRRLVGPHLHITRQAVAFDGDLPYWLDVGAFEALAQGASSTPSSSQFGIEDLQQAIELYRGDLLEGFYVRQAPAFEEWQRAQRARLRELAVQALHCAIAHHTHRGEAGHAAGIDYATRLLALEPWREGAHRHLMLLLAQSGQRGAALAQYETCRQALAEELGVEPGAETARLYGQIRDSALSVVAAAPAQIGDQELRLPGFLEERTEQIERPLFVARERELAKLDSLLEGTLAGQGRVVFVTGGPGRGKTALLDEFARRAMEAHPGLLVATGSCNAYSGVGDPYLPFREVLAMLTGDVEASWAAGTITRDHAQRLWAALPLAGQALLDHGPHVVPALIPGPPLLARATAAALAGETWLPQLRDRLERRRTAAEALEETDLFQQVTNLLRALAGAQPLLLILDDLQWADAASAGLLLHLGRRLAGSRILIAGAYRPEEVVPRPASPRDPRSVPHPLRQVLAELQRRSGDIWLDLSDVQEPEGRYFVDSLLDAEPNRLAEEFRRALFAHAGGHPLFTVELLRAMQERGDLMQDEAGAWVEGPALDWHTLPPRVEGIIKARIGRLDEGLREFLSVASVEGETFTAQVVAQVQQVSERQILRSLSQELEVRHRLVREQPALLLGRRRLWRYRFAHALFQQHLYNALGDGERAMLHAEIARALEELYAGRLEEVAVQLAHHYSETADDQRALKYFTLAGDVALAAYANREAGGYYRRALALEPPAPEKADLLSSLGEALARQNLFQEAMGVWQGGIECYQALGESDATARLYARSAWAARQAGDDVEDLKLCLEGLAQTGEAPDGPGLARLLHETARAYQEHALREKGEPFVRQALEMAERLGHVELQVLTLATWSTFPALSVEESKALAARAVELAEANDLLLAGVSAHRSLAHRLDDYSAQREHYQRGAELARQAGLTASQIGLLALLVPFGLESGEFREAEQALSQARLLLKDLNEPTRAAALVCDAEIHYLGYNGQWAACAQKARVQRASTRERGHERGQASAAGWLGYAILESQMLGSSVRADEWQEAEEALAEASEILDRSLSPTLGVWTRIQAGSLCVLQGRLGDAQCLLAEAREKARLQPMTPRIEGNLQWLAAHLATAAGHWAEAMEHFEAAVESLARLGEPWWCARLLLDRAQAHVSRGQPGDRQRAAELLREAQDAFQDMGVVRYAAIAQDRLQSMQTAHT